MTSLSAPESVERRLVLGSSWLGALFSAIGVFSNWALGGGGVLIWGCAIAALGFVLVAVAVRRGVSPVRAAVAFLAVAAFLIAVTWEANGGVRGSTTVAMAGAIVFAVLALPSRYAFSAIVGVLSFFLLLSLAELWDGIPATSPFLGMADALDSIITTVAVGSIIGGGVALMRRVYDQNLRQLLEASTRIEELAAKAMNADREKTRFLARMSHDLRTPLTAVLGSLELVSREPLRSEISHLLVQARERCHDLERIIGDLLHVEMIEDGDLQRLDTDVEIDQLVGSLASIARPRPGVEFKAHIDQNLPRWVRLDATRVTQAVGNLISNACKHCDVGHIDLHVSKQGEHLLFAVHDTGPGIAEADLQQLGKPYVQLVRGRERGGTGLGLYIARRIAELLGGRLDLSSVPGEGTVVTLCMPLAAASSMRTKAVQVAPMRPLRILVVDDEPVLRLMLQAMLEGMGHTVEHVEDGALAVARVLASANDGARFDVVLLDVQMPVMDGLEAARRIRELQAGPLIVGLSANAYPADRERAQRAGMNAFLTKPVTIDRLAATLASLNLS